MISNSLMVEYRTTLLILSSVKVIYLLNPVRLPKFERWPDFFLGGGKIQKRFLHNS